MVSRSWCDSTILSNRKMLQDNQLQPTSTVIHTAMVLAIEAHHTHVSYSCLRGTGFCVQNVHVHIVLTVRTPIYMYMCFKTVCEFHQSCTGYTIA